MHRLVSIGLVALAATAARAAEPPFRDDRSTPTAVIDCFYNAIKRQEIRRA